MAIIPTVGRKSFSTRLLIAALYIVLSAGAVTMVYPFALMLATSVTSRVDVNDFKIVPRYLYDEKTLFAKYADDKYQSDIETVNSRYGTDFAKLQDIAPPKVDPDDPKVVRRVEDWWEFSRRISPVDKEPCFQGLGKSYAPLRRMYQDWLTRRFKGDIDALNRLYLEENESFLDVYLPFERHQRREWQPENTPKMRDWLQYKATLPSEYLQVTQVDDLYSTFLKEDKYEGDIRKLNAAHRVHYKDFREAHLSPTLPANPWERPDWEEFVRNKLPFRYMRVDPSATRAYRAFLATRYRSIDAMNRRHGTHYRSFEELDLPEKPPTEGAPLVDWMDFIAKAVPVTSIRATNIENQYRDHLLQKFGSVAGVNRAFGTHFPNILAVDLPIYEADWVYAHRHARQIRTDFLTRNYRMVIEYILLHGRAVLNTVIFVVAVILTHLIVNPLCAYSLSRYSLPYAYKVLLFLLATMAFPAEVAMIPNFLLLKQFHMLNTYWALVLPGMASGFAIFLLKGFFDSLPRELYEAGIIDGASEARMFFGITVPLSKPIFAVIALQSFTAAYGAFMFALLVCQNPKMWTLMVWLYELQIGAPQFVTMAALTLAALPTLLVFIFAQNVIMRGIIIPSFK